MRFSRVLITYLQWLVLGISLCSMAAPAGAVSVGQVDDFEDGTTQNWYVGVQHPAPPQNQPSGGPGGDEDNWMLLTALGADGPGSRLAVINSTHWAGDYTAAGVTSIGVYLRNFSTSDLNIRLLLEDPMGGPPADAAITTDVFLPAESDWTYATFSLDPSDLIVLLGDLDYLLAHVTAIRIFHNPDPTYPPPPVVARIGVDDVEAFGDGTPVAETSWGRVKSLYR